MRFPTPLYILVLVFKGNSATVLVIRNPGTVSFAGLILSQSKPLVLVSKDAAELRVSGGGSLAVGKAGVTASHPQKFDELLQLASRGQHTNVDMLVKDVYGGAYQTLGLSGNLIASSFGKSTTADKGIGT